MLPETVIEALEDGSVVQRDKLRAVQGKVEVIRGFDDAGFERVVRAIKKRLKSPKLEAEVKALLEALTRDRVPQPVAVAAPAPPPVPVVAGDGVVAQLEAEIAEYPDAQDRYLAYGDYLAARGDVVGEMIGIGRELAKNPGHKEMRRAHDELAPKVLGRLADCEDLIAIEWHMGFIKRCRLAYTMDRFNGVRKPDVTIEEVLGWLLDGPGRFLQHLVVGLVRHDDNTYARVAAVLAKHERRSLRSLFLGDFESDECELNWTDLGDLSDLWKAVPNLGELTLRGGRMRTGPMRLPRLQRLETITGGLDAGSLGHIASADWPELVDLQLQVGAAHEGAATSPEPLAPLLAAERVPKLRRLGLTNCEFTDALVDLLADSKVLPQLEELDLSIGTLSDAGLDRIDARRDRFAHLKKLVVNEPEREYAADRREAPPRRALLAWTGVQVVWDDRYGPVYE